MSDEGDEGIIVLGVDPGPREHGWALVRVVDPQRALFVGCGKHEGNAEGVLSLLGVHLADVVAIESPTTFMPTGPGGKFIPTVATALFGTTRQVGRLAAVAELDGWAVVEMTASDWRREVCGKGSSTDAQIAADITRLVAGWPRRSNVHVRDAAGVALAAGWGWLREKGRAA